MTFTFEKGERLKSRKVIGNLFRKGHSFGKYPLRLVWMPMEKHLSDFPVQFALSVPRKKFRRAVDRNRIKRLVREAYRFNKHKLYESLDGEDQQIAFMIIYTGNEEFSFQKIAEAMRHIIRRFLKTRKLTGRTTN